MFYNGLAMHRNFNDLKTNKNINNEYIHRNKRKINKESCKTF